MNGDGVVEGRNEGWCGVMEAWDDGGRLSERGIGW